MDSHLISRNIISWQDPQYPKFRLNSERMKSFVNLKWPNNLRQKPIKLANAGFFYTGIEDKVICFFCGGGLYKWELDDDPFTEHLKHFNRCSYMQLFVGNESIINQNSSETSSIVNSNITCKICHDTEATIIFVPCYHLVACVYCASCLSYCSICRCKIRRLIKVFIP